MEHAKRILSPSGRGRVCDLTGQRFGRLVAIKCVASHQRYGAMWLCKCDCGNEKVVFARKLKYGEGKGCGCLEHPVGVQHMSWKGGCTEHGGYRLLRRKDPLMRHPYKEEHRVVVEDAIGRRLSSDELIHHINCDTKDNRLENLAIVTRSEHSLIHHALRRGEYVHVTSVSELCRRSGV